MKSRVEQYEEWANSVTREGGIPPALMEGYEYQEGKTPRVKANTVALKAFGFIAALCAASFLMAKYF